MAYLTVDITNASDGPFSLATLFAGGTIAGVTLTPAVPPKPPRIVAQLLLQADPANAGDVLVGTDASMLPTAGGGTGQDLQAGSGLQLNNVALTGVFISATAAPAKVNIIANGGFQ